jgi:hypothetical protein
VEEMDLGSVFDSEMIEDDVIPALEMAMYDVSDKSPRKDKSRGKSRV